jgi:RNA polymerase sigma factor (sigma-70 family)
MEPDDEARLRRIVAAIWRRWHGRLPADLFDDCLQEARLCLRRLRARLETLREDERDSYAAASLANHLREFLRRERRRPQATVACEDIVVDEAAQDWDAFSGDDIRQRVAREDLAAALARMHPRDVRLLDLSYRYDLGDREVAARLGMFTAAVKKKRQRVLADLRKALDRKPTNRWGASEDL